MTLLTARQLGVTYAGRQVLGPIDLALSAGRLLGVVGPNGAGKSTLLRALAGLVPATGQCSLPAQLPADERARARHVGYLPQTPDVAWPLSVTELVALGRLPHGGGDSAQGRRAIAHAIEALGLRGLAARDVQTLSGGERMRTHLARLAAGEHRVLLVDEPTVSLDPRYQLEVLDYLRQLAHAGAAVMIVLHDLPLAVRYCDELLVLEAGIAVRSGPPQEVLDDALLTRVFGVRGIRLRNDGGDALVGIDSLPPPGAPA